MWSLRRSLRCGRKPNRYLLTALAARSAPGWHRAVHPFTFAANTAKGGFFLRKGSFAAVNSLALQFERACNNMRAQIAGLGLRSGPAAILRAPQLQHGTFQHDAFQTRTIQDYQGGQLLKSLSLAPLLLRPSPFHGSALLFDPARSRPRSELRIPFLRRSPDTSLSGQISFGGCSPPCRSGFRRVHYGKICL